MAKLGISTGTIPNDNTGDSLILGAIKINSNFDEIYTYLGAGSTTVLSTPIWTTTSVGISTLRNVGVGTTNPTSALTVSGDAIVTGVITASTFSGSISNAIYSVSAGVATYSSTSGVSTSSTKVSIAETNLGTNSVILSSGAVLGINSLYIDSALTYNAATNTLFASTFSGTATYATTAGISTYSPSSGIATYATTAGISTYSPSSGIATYADSAGISTYSSSSGIATYATTAGISTLSEGLTGTPNLIVGIITATSFIGDGSGLTGIVASGSGIVIKDSGSTVGTAGTIDFGTNLSVSPISAGVVTVTASGGGGESYWVQTAAGIHTLSNVGVGTTNPTSKLSIDGDIIVSGVVTAISFIGSLSGTATTATNLDDAANITTGTIDSARLSGDYNINVSYATTTGIATVAQGLEGVPNVTVGILTASSGNFTGIITSSGIDVVGVVTATSFSGPLKGLPQNLQTSSYTLSSTDAGKHVAITTGGVTLNSGTFNIGDTVTLFNDSQYTQMINVGAGVTMRRISIGDLGSRGLNGYGLATILCIRSDEYVISGAGLT